MITLEINSERYFPWTTKFNVSILVSPETFLAIKPRPEEIEALKQADVGTVADKLDAIALIARMLERQGLGSEIKMAGELKEFFFSGDTEFDPGEIPPPDIDLSFLGALYLARRVIKLNASPKEG